MPIVKRSNLPAYDRLIKEGRPILPSNRALAQDIRELHIGFLNMMPDAAMEATERQWLRLIGESNRVAQIYIHLFNLPVVERGAEAQEHINNYYEPFEKIQKDGLDALIVTGANEETNPHVSDLENWGPLKEALSWAYDNVTSTLCSCIAAHGLMTYNYDQQPIWLDKKRLGVFPHKVLHKNHPLVRGMNTKFDAPHSRFSEVTRKQFDDGGMITLVEGEESGVYMAVSKDGFRQICLQGHPEYDTFSLLKEYKRDVNWYQEGILEEYPDFPKHYFSKEIEDELTALKEQQLSGKKVEFPEEKITETVDNTWADSARSLIASWIGHVYQITHVDRKKPFMDGVDPDNPLGI